MGVLEQLEQALQMRGAGEDALIRRVEMPREWAEALLAVATLAKDHDCARYTVTADEGTGYCRMCAAVASLETP